MLLLLLELLLLRLLLLGLRLLRLLGLQARRLLLHGCKGCELLLLQLEQLRQLHGRQLRGRAPSLHLRRLHRLCCQRLQLQHHPLRRLPRRCGCSGSARSSSSVAAQYCHWAQHDAAACGERLQLDVSSRGQHAWLPWPHSWPLAGQACA